MEILLGGIAFAVLFWTWVVVPTWAKKRREKV